MDSQHYLLVTTTMVGTKSSRGVRWLWQLIIVAVLNDDGNGDDGGADDDHHHHPHA